MNKRQSINGMNFQVDKRRWGNDVCKFPVIHSDHIYTQLKHQRLRPNWFSWNWSNQCIGMQSQPYNAFQMNLHVHLNILAMIFFAFAKMQFVAIQSKATWNLTISCIYIDCGKHCIVKLLCIAIHNWMSAIVLCK